MAKHEESGGGKMFEAYRLRMGPAGLRIEPGLTAFFTDTKCKQEGALVAAHILPFVL